MFVPTTYAGLLKRSQPPHTFVLLIYRFSSIEGASNHKNSKKKNILPVKEIEGKAHRIRRDPSEFFCLHKI